MKKRIVSVMLAVMMTAALASGCGESAGKSAETSKTAELQEESTTNTESGGAQRSGTGDENQKDAAGDGDQKDAAGDGDQKDAADDENQQLADGEDSSTDEDEENYDTGDASNDDPRNEDGIGESELLVVSFGTSYNDSRCATIGGIEQCMEDRFADYSVRRAFTSQIIIDHVKKRDGEEIDNMTQALDRAVNNGVKTLVVQPTHLMNGFEYDELQEALAGYSDAFEKIAVGEPLLTSDEDFKLVEKTIVEVTSDYDDGETAICFMGHGTEADSNQVYEKLQKLLTEDGYENYYIGTVEAAPSVEDVLAKVQEGNYKRVVLRPLMIVAGDHANNDMAGDEEDSWKTIFENAGYKVECVVEGLGSLEEIQNLLADHAQTAIEQM